MCGDDNDIDIDGRDSNGNFVGDYRSCYDNIVSPYSRSNEPYVHVIPTKEQVYASRLRSYKWTLELRRDELSRFNKYAAEALKEYEKYVTCIYDKKQEIADLENWIQELKAKHGVEV